MRSSPTYLLRKDLRASVIPLLFTVLAVTGFEFSLAILSLPFPGFPFQVALWTWALWILQTRCKEDAPNRSHCNWIAARPISISTLAKGKGLFLGFALLMPLFLARFLIALSLGFGFLNGLLLGLYGILPVGILGLWVLNSYAYPIRKSVGFVTGGLALSLWILAGFRESAVPGTPPNEPQWLPHKTTAHPSTLLDPWIAVDFPTQYILTESSFQGEFGYESRSWRITSQRHSPDWAWHFRRRFPERTVIDIRAESPPIHVGSLRQKRIKTSTGWTKTYQSRELPETLQAKKIKVESYLSWSLALVDPVWTAPYSPSRTQVMNHVRGQLQVQDEESDAHLILTAAVTTGLKGKDAFWNWFSASRADAVITLESGPESPLLILPAEAKIFDNGFPAFSRSYKLTFKNPERWFPENTPLTLTVYSATPGGYQRLNAPRNLTFSLPRGAELYQQVEEALRLMPSPQTDSPTKVFRTKERIPDTLQDKLDMIDRILTISEMRPERIQEFLHTNLKNLYDPENPAHNQFIFDHLDHHPYLYYVLPEALHAQALNRIHTLLKSPPIQNPGGIFSLVNELDLSDPVVREGLAWCFIHSNRRDYLTLGNVHPKRRISVQLLEKFTEQEQQSIWDQTWKSILLEESMYAHTTVSPDYILEALRRNSPNAIKAACHYSRKEPEKGHQSSNDKTTFQEIDTLLQSRLSYTGPKADFTTWFRRNGFRAVDSN